WIAPWRHMCGLPVTLRTSGYINIEQMNLVVARGCIACRIVNHGCRGHPAILARAQRDRPRNDPESQPAGRLLQKILYGPATLRLPDRPLVRVSEPHERKVLRQHSQLRA